MKRKGAEILCECLIHAGIKRIYGVIGTSVLEFVNSLSTKRELIKYISCRHEQTAGSMADAEGRLTGRPGVVLTHSGAGTLNITLPLAIAYKDCSPLIAVTGGKRRNKRGRDGFLEIDHLKIFEKICKAGFYVEKAGDIPEVFSKAYRTAMTEAKGPVLIEIPEDLWSEEADAEPENMDLTPFRPPPVDEEIILKIYSHLKSSRKPALLAGRGINTRENHSFLKFIEKNTIPVLTTGNGKGTIPEDHRLFSGRPGYAGGDPVGDYVLKNADFLLLLGCTLSDLVTYEDTWLPQAKSVVMVNADPSVLKERYPVEIPLRVYGDALQFIEKFAELPPLSPSEEWLKELNERKRRWESQLEEFANPEKNNPSPAFVLKKLRELLPRDSIITTGQGVHLLYANYYLKCYTPLSFLSSTNFGAMGFGFPASLAAKLVYPEREVVAILGDGDFMMTLQDLETAVREKIGVKMFIMNDNSYRVLFLSQIMAIGEGFGTEHLNPDFIKLAEAFGVKGYRIGKNEDAEKTLREILMEKGPCLIEIPVDKYDMPPMNMEAIMGMKRG